MNRIKVAIADDVAETRANIRRLLNLEKDMEICEEAATGLEAINVAERVKPDVILMDVNMPEMDGIRATEVITQKYPDTSVVIVSVQGEKEYLKKAMMAGAREYLVKPFTGDELAETVRQVHDLNRSRSRAPAPESPARNRHKGNFVSLFSSKGGVGKSFIAVNLAVKLAALKQKVALVDLDLQGGDVALMLNMSSQRTVMELIRDLPLYDPGLVDSYLTTHITGLRVLPAPLRPEQAELVSGEDVNALLDFLTQCFDLIILDLPTQFTDVCLAALDRSDQVYLVSSLDLSAIKHTKLNMEVLNDLNYQEKIKVIINRSSDEIGIKYEDVIKAIGLPVAVDIPSDGRLAVAAVNKGVPLAASHPSCKISQKISNLANTVISVSAGAGKPGVFAKVFGMN